MPKMVYNLNDIVHIVALMERVPIDNVTIKKTNILGDIHIFFRADGDRAALLAPFIEVTSDIIKTDHDGHPIERR